IPEVDIEQFREEHLYDEEFEDLTDDEIIKMHIIEMTLENCKFKDITNNEQSTIEDKESLGGFKISLDLSTIVNNKPLEKGIYNVYIKLEQLFHDNDDIKY